MGPGTACLVTCVLVYEGLHVVCISAFQLLCVSLVHEYSIFNSTADRHLGSLHFGDVCTNFLWTLAYMIHVHSFSWLYTSNIIDSSQGTHRSAIVDIAKEMLQNVVLTSAPTSKVWVGYYSMVLSTLLLVILNFSHLGGCVIVFHCYFNLYLLMNSVLSDFYMPLATWRSCLARCLLECFTHRKRADCFIWVLVSAFTAYPGR